LCFGSELGSIAPLREAAARLTDEPDAFASLLQASLKAGNSYPKAYAQAAEALGAEPGAQQWIAEPNNSLGLHYMMALSRLGSRIEPHTITRVKAGYHDESVNDSSIASATAIRRLVFSDGVAHAAAYLPDSSLQILQQLAACGRPPVS
ncbi:nucleotidyltransferase, partial [Clostridium perfringens]|nr:nucleotidyltransferase [Clostridium perfringens]